LRVRRAVICLSALGPLPAICDDLYKSRLSGFACCALNVVNWAGSGLSVIIRLSYKECPFLTAACFNYANLAASLLATKAWLSCFQRKRQRGRPENAIKARPKRMARPSPNKFFAKFALEIFRREVT
jgi:hypothetical protein